MNVNNHLFNFGFFLFLLSTMFLVLALMYLAYFPPVGVFALLVDVGVMFGGASLMIRGKHGRAVGEVKRCESCGRETRVCAVELKECRSYLVVRKERSVEGRLCWECIRRAFREITQNNAIFGWWSLPGLFRTPMLLVFNFVHYLRARQAVASAPGGKI